MVIELSRPKYQDKDWISAISCCWIVMDHWRCLSFWSLQGLFTLCRCAAVLYGLSVIHSRTSQAAELFLLSSSKEKKCESSTSGFIVFLTST